LRKNQSLYMEESIFKAFNRYASMYYPRSGCEIWEEALVERMQSKPVNGLIISIQKELAEKLPGKREEILMGIISEKVITLIDLIDKLNKDDDPSKLKEKLSRQLSKGVDIKNPTEEFLVLLERAIDYV